MASSVPCVLCPPGGRGALPESMLEEYSQSDDMEGQLLGGGRSQSRAATATAPSGSLKRVAALAEGASGGCWSGRLSRVSGIAAAAVVCALLLAFAGVRLVSMSHRAPAAPAPATATPAKSRELELLPPWVKQVDSRTGLAYYVNPETGASQWEAPLAVRPMPSPAAVEPVPVQPAAAPAAEVVAQAAGTWSAGPQSSPAVAEATLVPAQASSQAVTETDAVDALGIPWAVPDTGDFFHLEGYDCWKDGASTPLEKLPGAIAAHSTITQCKLACRDEARCVGFIMGEKKQHGQCWLRSAVQLEKCQRAQGRDLADFDFFMKRDMSDHGESTAQTQEFYMYRASAEGMLRKFGLGEVNTGNMDGVLWYLMNEIVTNYGSGVRCPRRFGISKIHRFKVKVKSTRALIETGMNYGVRFAYDQGKCEGRCFEGNKCSGEGDCAAQYQKYGFVVGCNRFNAHYPFPVAADGAAPWGVWYSLPLSGRCEGEPTGEKDCTWSFEDAGEVSLKELEDVSAGNENCCEGHCTNFWHDNANPGAMSWRVNAATDLFHKKYPEMPRDFKAPPCDFDVNKWYAQDPWYKQDPWR